MLSSKSGPPHSLFFKMREAGRLCMESSGKGKFSPLSGVVERLGYDCVGIELVNDCDATFLRVYIDTIGGVQVKDCELVSRSLSVFLDENSDLVPGKYFLEVSSPGIERPLFSMDDYRRFIGKKVRLKMRSSARGRKVLRGVVLSAQNDLLTIESEAEKAGDESLIEVSFGDISRGNLVYEEEKSKRRSS